MRLVIKIRITLANKNILVYLSKYKFLLPLLAEQSRVQPYSRLHFAQLLLRTKQHFDRCVHNKSDLKRLDSVNVASLLLS